MNHRPFNALHIDTLYHQCLWRRGELDTMRITVLSAGGHEVSFHRRRIGRIKGRIAKMLLDNMRTDMMRSVSSKGRPWMLMRSDREGQPMGMMEGVDKLFTLAQACEFVTAWMGEVDGLDHSLPFVVVEDIRIRNWLQRTRGRRLTYG